MQHSDWRGVGRGCALAGVLVGLTACAGEGTGSAGEDDALAGDGLAAAGANSAATIPTASTDTGEVTESTLERFASMLEGTSGDTERASVAPSLGAATAEPDAAVTDTAAAALAPTPVIEVAPVTPAAPASVAVAEAPPTEALVTAPFEPVPVAEPIAGTARIAGNESGTGPDALEKVAAAGLAVTDEPVAEAEPAVDEAKVAEPEALAKIEPEPEPATEPETVAKTVTEMGSESETSSEPETVAETVAEIEPEPTTEPEPETVAEAEPEPASESEFEPEAVAEAEPEPEPAAALPVDDDSYRVHISWTAAAGSDLGYYVYYGESDDDVEAFAKQVTIDEVEDGGVMTATLEAPGDLDTGGDRLCFAISAWNSVGETERSAVRCVDKQAS